MNPQVDSQKMVLVQSPQKILFKKQNIPLRRPCQLGVLLQDMSSLLIDLSLPVTFQTHDSVTDQVPCLVVFLRTQISTQ